MTTYIQILIPPFIHEIAEIHFEVTWTYLGMLKTQYICMNQFFGYPCLQKIDFIAHFILEILEY